MKKLLDNILIIILPLLITIFVFGIIFYFFINYAEEDEATIKFTKQLNSELPKYINEEIDLIEFSFHSGAIRATYKVKTDNDDSLFDAYSDLTLEEEAESICSNEGIQSYFQNGLSWESAYVSHAGEIIKLYRVTEVLCKSLDSSETLPK